MLKNVVRLEHKIGERVYHFMCDNDSPTSEVKDAIFQFSAFVASIEKQAQDAAAKQAEQKAAEEPKPEVKEGQ